MENLDRTEGGITELPPTQTSSVPSSRQGLRQAESRRDIFTVASLVEAVLRVAVAREDGHPVPAALEPDGSVDDQSLGAADAQVRVEKDEVLLPRSGGHYTASYVW
jgi:hypothetical protein